MVRRFVVFFVVVSWFYTLYNVYIAKQKKKNHQIPKHIRIANFFSVTFVSLRRNFDSSGGRAFFLFFFPPTFRNDVVVKRKRGRVRRFSEDISFSTKIIVAGTRRTAANRAEAVFVCIFSFLKCLRTDENRWNKTQSPESGPLIPAVMIIINGKNIVIKYNCQCFLRDRVKREIETTARFLQYHFVMIAYARFVLDARYGGEKYIVIFYVDKYKRTKTLKCVLSFEDVSAAVKNTRENFIIFF